MSMSRKWSQNPMAWAAAMALILPFAVGAVHAAEPAKQTAPSDAPVPPPTIDSDGDGKADAWDRDGNGKAMPGIPMAMPSLISSMMMATASLTSGAKVIRPAGR